MQERHNSIGNTLDLHLSYINPSILDLDNMWKLLYLGKSLSLTAAFLTPNKFASYSVNPGPAI